MLPRSRLALLLPAFTLALTACGGPRETDATTVDGLTLDRGVLVGGQETGRGQGVRALSAPRPEPISALRSDMRVSVFRDREDEGATFTAYLNGLKPAAGERELAYPGDRVGWLTRDAADPSPAPSAVVGLFPAPFNARFTAKRRFYPVRVQCAEVASAACRGVERALLASDPGARVTSSDLTDQSVRMVLRVYAGPWPALRDRFARGRLSDALAIERPAEQNGFGASIDARATQIQIGAAFGEASSAPPQGAGSGLIFAIRDELGLPVWIVTGTDEAGIEAAAGALTRDDLAGRVAAVIPAGD